MNNNTTLRNFSKIPTGSSRNSMTSINNNIIGKNIVKCEGKFIIGIKEQLPLLLSILFLGILLISIWSVFLLPFFLENNMIYIPIIKYFLFLFSGYYFLKCFITEPGIIPRNYYKYTKEYIIDQERLKDAEMAIDKISREKKMHSKSQISLDTVINEDNKISSLLTEESDKVTSKKNSRPQNKPKIYT